MWRLILIISLCYATASLSHAQSGPQILKIEPPSWWTKSSLSPIQILIHGRNLQRAQVRTSGPGLRVVSTPRINERGTYLFVDVAIARGTTPGLRKLTLTTPSGMVQTEFEILNSLNRQGRFQGFSPADVIYLIMIDRFSDGDANNNEPTQSSGLYDRSNQFYYHGGDLQGIINHLPYLKDLGVTALWLTPWYDNYNARNEIELKDDRPSTGFHGYNPQDFYAVEEHFGNLAKLRELVEKAHRLGLKIIQDEVVNHTGPYHPWVDDPPTPTWFNGTKESHLNNVFQTWVLHDPHPVENLKRETMEGWFLNFLPDLNQDDREVSRYFIQNTLWWIGVTGLDGIRMDTWQYVPDTFWHEWTRALKHEYPNFTVVGEVKDGDVVHTSYFQGARVREATDSGLDSLLDFPLFYAIRHAFAEGKSLDEVPKTLAKDYLYLNPNVLVTLLGGHDDGRFMSEQGATIAGLKLANLFVLTTRGIPQLYYGDEIAMAGPNEPTTRADFPGGFPDDKRDAFTKVGRTIAAHVPEQDLFEYVRTVAHLHTELQPLRSGQLINLYVSEQQYGYARRIDNAVAVVVINNDIKPSTLEFPVVLAGLANGDRLIDRLAISGEVRVVDGHMRVSLPARSGALYTKR